MISLGVIEIVLLAGAIAWASTAMVGKSGPFNSLALFRNWVKQRLGSNSPLDCYHCASFWIGIVVVILYAADPIIFRPLIQFFGVLGIAQALRGASGEF